METLEINRKLFKKALSGNLDIDFENVELSYIGNSEIKEVQDNIKRTVEFLLKLLTGEKRWSDTTNDCGISFYSNDPYFEEKIRETRRVFRIVGLNHFVTGIDEHDLISPKCKRYRIKMVRFVERSNKGWWND